MPKFSEAYCRDVKGNRTTRRELWDSTCPGLCLLVSPTGSKQFVAKWRFNGQKYKKSLGAWGTLSLDAAQHATRELRKAAHVGQDPRVLEIKKAESLAEMKAHEVGVLWPQYVAERLTKESTRDRFEGIYNAHIESDWKERRVESIRKDDCRKKIQAAKERGPHAAASMLTVLSAFFNWCIGAGVIEVSPVAGLKKPVKAEDNVRERTLTDAEVRDVWDAAVKMDNNFGALVRVLLATGQRRNEVACMEWAHVNLKTRIWENRVTKTRGIEPRICPVYLNDQALAVLEKITHIEGAKYVFSTDGKTPISGFSKFKMTIDKEAPGVAEWRLHDLRRTMSTNMQRLKISPHVKESCLAHTVKGLAKHYDQWEYTAEKKQAWTRWGALLSRLVSGDADAVAAYVAQFQPADIPEGSNVVALHA